MFLGVTFMQKWSALLKGCGQEKMSEVIKTISAWMANLPASGAPVSDICEF